MAKTTLVCASSDGIATNKTFSFCSICGGGQAGSGVGSIKTRFFSSGIISNFSCTVYQNPTATDSKLFLFKNSYQACNARITITASTTGSFTDSTSTDQVLSGDEIYVQVGTATPPGSFLYFTNVYALFDSYTGTTIKKYQTQNASGAINESTASRTTYVELTGRKTASSITSEVNAQAKFRTPGVFKNLFVLVLSNARTSTTTFGTRVAASNGNLTVSVPASTRGVFTDVTNSDYVAEDTLNNYYVTTGTGAGSITANLGIEFEGLYSKFMTIGGGINTFFNFTYYQPIENNGGTGGGISESLVSMKPKMSATLSKLWCFVTTNTVTAASTLRLRKNGANGNQVVSITASTTGAFEDIANTDTVTSSDDICYQIAAGATGTQITMSLITMQWEVTDTPTTFTNVAFIQQ